MPLPRRPQRAAAAAAAGDRLDRLLADLAAQRAASQAGSAVAPGESSGDSPVEWDDEPVHDSPVAWDDEPVHGGEWLPERAAVRRRVPREQVLPPEAMETVDMRARHRSQRSASAPRPGGPGLLSVPASLRGADARVSPMAVIGLLLVVVAVAAVLALRVWLVNAQAAPVPVTAVPPTRTADAARTTMADDAAAEGETAVEAAAQTAAPGSSAGTPQVTPVLILVHVAGEVRAPGVVRLDPGARVLDVVEAAGGLTGRADTDRLNLARLVTDGERVWVPAPGEEVPDLVEPVAAGPVTTSAPTGGAARSPVTMVNLNTADQAALEELPGVGPVTAGHILTWRSEHGRFTSVEELLEVSGIGERTLEQLRPHVTL